MIIPCYLAAFARVSSFLSLRSVPHSFPLFRNSAAMCIMEILKYFIKPNQIIRIQLFVEAPYRPTIGRVGWEGSGGVKKVENIEIMKISASSHPSHKLKNNSIVLKVFMTKILLARYRASEEININSWLWGLNMECCKADFRTVEFFWSFWRKNMSQQSLLSVEFFSKKCFFQRHRNSRFSIWIENKNYTKKLWLTF